MDENNRRDEELFEQLRKNKKKKTTRRIITALVIAGIIVGALGILVANLRRRVDAAVAVSDDNVTTYTVAYGSISTRVTATGFIADVDTEVITVPEGVEIDEVVAVAGAHVQKGDVIATLDMSTVLSTMASVQSDIAELDEQIAAAGTDKVNSAVKAGVRGRVKAIYMEKNSDVAECVSANGALILLSLDGYMSVEIPAGELSAGDAVKVVRADGKVISGKVERVLNGKATVLVTDNGPMLGESVTVTDADGAELGSGELSIHNSFAVTGFAGTVAAVSVRENQLVTAQTTVCTLKNTSYSAAYDSLLKQRRELEKTLLELLQLRQDSALRAPFDGGILKIDYEEDEDDSSSASTASSSSYGMSAYAAFFSGGSASTTTTTTKTDTAEVDGTAVVTMSRDEQMEASLSVDETDILSLQLGQRAEVTIESIGDEVYEGTVTEIDRTAVSSSGVTSYAATVTFAKGENMLAGMTAEVTINITGNEHVLIVPADAVHRTSSTSFVYTTFDTQTGAYGGEIEVVTGISNDEYIEILSGLNEGDQILYEESTFNPFMMMGFGSSTGSRTGGNNRGGSMPGGSMPGGGNNRGGRP